MLTNQRSFSHYNRGYEGAMKDQMSQRAKKLLLDNRKKIVDVAMKFKYDLGIGYATRNKKNGQK